MLMKQSIQNVFTTQVQQLIASQGRSQLRNSAPLLRARRGSGDTAMLAQYAAYAIKRTKELATWDLRPADTRADGTPIVELGQLARAEDRAAMATAVRDAAATLATR